MIGQDKRLRGRTRHTPILQKKQRIIDSEHYVGGIFGTAPYVWNGASLVQAAIWNTTLFASLGYLVLYWALQYGMIVASPDDQNFMD